MKRFICLMVAMVAVASFGISQVDAHDGFGVNSYSCYGYNYNNAGFERPPYFALFPPVYYSDQIVRRPYGVSPFAAQPGVIPVEMTVPPQPQKVMNPYVNPAPSDSGATKVEKTGTKVDTDT